MSRRVVVISSSRPPSSHGPSTGGGLRTLQLVETAKRAGHRVHVGIERAAGSAEWPEDFGFTTDDLAATLQGLRPDVVLVEQWALLAHLGDYNGPIAVDLHGSLLLENVYRRGGPFDPRDAGAKIEALRRADRIFVPTDAQAAWFGAWACAAGFEPTDLPIDVLPLADPLAAPPGASAVPALPPKSARAARTRSSAAKEPASLHLLYAGARWPWIDSESALCTAAEFVASLRSEGADASLLISTWDPPSHGVAFDLAPSRWPATDRALRPFVGRGTELVPATDHVAWRRTLESRPWVALDLWAPNAERRLAATTRVIEWLSHGIPVVTGEGAEWASPILNAGAGWTVPWGDAGALRALLRSLSEDVRRVRDASVAARTLSMTRHSVEGAGASLRAFLDHPRRAMRAPASVVTVAAEERLAHMRTAMQSFAEAHAAEHERLIARHTAEVAELRGHHHRESEQARIEHHEGLSRAERERREAIDMLERRFEHQIREHEQRAEVRLREQEESGLARLRQLEEQHRERHRAMESEARAEQRRLVEDHRQECARTQGEHDARIAEARARAQAEELRWRAEVVAARTQTRDEADAQLRAVAEAAAAERAATEAAWTERLAALEARLRLAEDGRTGWLSEIAALRARDAIQERRATEAEDRLKDAEARHGEHRARLSQDHMRQEVELRTRIADLGAERATLVERLRAAEEELDASETALRAAEEEARRPAIVRLLGGASSWGSKRSWLSAAPLGARGRQALRVAKLWSQHAADRG